MIISVEAFCVRTHTHIAHKFVRFGIVYLANLINISQHISISGWYLKSVRWSCSVASNSFKAAPRTYHTHIHTHRRYLLNEWLSLRTLFLCHFEKHTHLCNGRASGCARERERATHGLTRVKSSIAHHYIHFIILFTSLNIDLGIFELFSFRIACRLLRQKMNILLIFVYAVVVFIVTVVVVAVARLPVCGACLRNPILFMIYYFDIQLESALLTISMRLNSVCMYFWRMRNENKDILVCRCLQHLTHTGITLAWQAI